MELFDELLPKVNELGKHEHKIYIPTKGRAKSIVTNKLLSSLSCSYALVVEEQDYASYREEFPTDEILCIDKQNQGIYYVRSWIKQYSRSLGETHHWQLDDDINKLQLYLDGKRTKMTDSSPFRLVELIAEEYSTVGASGFIHGAFAFAKKTKLGLNTQCCSCMLLNNSTPYEFRPDIIEDTDYSLQLLYGGYNTINYHTFIYECPPQMKMSGGNTDDFRSGKLYSRQYNLSKEYPGYFELYEKDGISKVKPSRIWRQFKHTPSNELEPKSTLETLIG